MRLALPLHRLLTVFQNTNFFLSCCVDGKQTSQNRLQGAITLVNQVHRNELTNIAGNFIEFNDI